MTSIANDLNLACGEFCKIDVIKAESHEINFIAMDLKTSSLFVIGFGLNLKQ